MKFFLTGIILFSLCQLSSAQTSNLKAGTIGLAQQICYNTAPAKLYQVSSPTGGTGSYTYQWQRSTNNKSWNNITSATQSSYTSPALTANTWFRLRVTSGSYGTVSTNTILITVNANLTSGSIGTAQSICYNATPSPLIQLTAPAGGTRNYTYQWQSSANNSSWTNIAGATSSGYSPPALTSNMYYRRSVTSGGCGTVNSASILITVNTQLSPGSIGSAQSICYNTTPATLTQLTAATGGNGTYTYQWQSSTNNSTWVNISGATSTNYTPTELTSSRYFRRNVTSGNCGTASSSSILITVNSQLIAGTIGSTQSICYNSSPAGLTQLTAPSGGTGIYSYQWQSSTNNSTWSSISGATAATYSPPTLNANSYFRRNVTSGNCGTSNSSSVLITVYAQLTPGTIGSDQSIPFNTVPASLSQFTAPTGGTGSFAFQWQSSTDNVNWIDVTGATASGYSPPVLTSSTYYRRIVTSGNCELASSAAILITVDNAQIFSGTIGTAQTICYNTLPSPLTQFTPPLGGSGSYIYQWQSSADDATWSNITGATDVNYSPPILTSSTYYRLSVSSGTIGPVYSTSVLISILPAISQVQLYDNATIDNYTSISFNVSITGGISPYTINYSRNGVAQPSIVNYTSGTPISTGILSTGTYLYVLTSVTDLNGCNVQNLGSGITIIATASSSYIPVDSLFRTETPSSSYNDRSYELGTEFLTLSNGFITKARLYSHINEGGSHTVRLWRFDGPSYTLVAGPFNWNLSSGIKGWREFVFTSPVAVEANKIYIISISNGPDLNYQRTLNYQSLTVGSYVRYNRGVYSTVLGTVPTSSYASSCYFRDVVFAINIGNLTPGTIGTNQSICFNSTAAALTQLASPTGGTGSYAFQWQSSTDTITWANISGATLPVYTPPALSSNTYYRRMATSGSYNPVYSNPVLIKVFTSAQLHDNITIFNNTSTEFNVTLSGGTPPYTIYYLQNGSAQPSIANYTSGKPISTGILPTGTYLYFLTSATDLNGCNAQSLGSGITITATASSSYIPVDSLFRTEAPSSSYNDRSYELGTEFLTLSNGFITKARLYSHINEGGSHTVRLWQFDGSSYTLVAGPFNWNLSSGIKGWREFVFTSPVAVEANKTYIISISNGPDLNYQRTLNYQSPTVGSYVRYNRGVYSTVLGTVPTSSYASSCYFRDVVFAINIGNLTPGTIGTNQSICFNSTAAALTQLASPTGGTGSYAFQWQSSTDTITWANISGATLPVYTPPALSSNSYYRRMVTSGNYGPVYSNLVLIKVFTSAQLHDNTTIFNNTSAEFNVTLSGGTSPYTIYYMQNTTNQSVIYNYVAEDGVLTGNLATGIYTYELTSILDANGCTVHSLGTPIDIKVRSPQTVLLNKALVIVNSSSASYVDYTKYIKPYFDNFGIPYEECDIFTTAIPILNDYALIVFGHKNVYSSGYPITELEAAVSEGAGLYSFDPHLFDYAGGFNEFIAPRTVKWNNINILNTSHYITQYHSPDSFNPTNSVELLIPWSVTQNSSLVGGTDLANMSTVGVTVSILQVSNYGQGKVVKWCGYDWVFDNVLGPVYGMDDLIWRGMVWAARKPFIMQGLPPMITMRVDDVNSNGGGITNNFDWLKIANEYGFIPWCGTFNSEMPVGNIPLLKNLIDTNKATAFPHSFRGDNFIYFNHVNLSSFDAAANVRAARDFYINNGLKISNFLVPHFYELSSTSLSEIKAMGGEFLGIHMLPDQFYFADPAPAWINCEPYRINRNGYATDGRPVSYGGNITLNGIQFFNCVTEIRDDGGYEWFPDNNVTTTSARGIRHLRRALNSMVLTTLFTHEYHLVDISSDNWRTILSQVTLAINGYNPEYTSMDYAVKYIRAKSNIRIANVMENSSSLEISYTGSNDMDTKCYLFTEKSGQINYRFIPLPQINGNGQVNVIK